MKTLRSVFIILFTLSLASLNVVGQASSYKYRKNFDERLKLFIEYQRTGQWDKVSELLGNYYCVGRERFRYTPEQKQKLIEHLRGRPMLSLDLVRTTVASGTDNLHTPLNKQYRWITAFIKFCSEPDCIYIETRLSAYIDKGKWFFTPLEKEFYNLNVMLAAPNNSFNRSAISAAFIENLNLSAFCARPVNSGVRWLLSVDY